MATYPKINRYLTQYRGHWYYQRMVPARFAHIDSRNRIRYSLHTTSLETARVRRDRLANADLEYWNALAIDAAENLGVTMATFKVAEQRHRAAQARALAFGLEYKTAEILSQDAAVDNRVEQLLERIELIDENTGKSGIPPKAETEAILGGVPDPVRPCVKISDAFALYLNEIAYDEQAKKSPKQQYSWEKTKRTSINYFIDLVGDIDMEEITREMATSYRSWWIERMVPGDEQLRPAKPNTANRHIGNMRRLYEDYFTHIGEEERLNPFRKMFFKDNQDTKIPSFENDWVRDRILVPNLFDELNDELRLMIYVLIETGARTSEICNLQPENIGWAMTCRTLRSSPRAESLKPGPRNVKSP